MSGGQRQRIAIARVFALKPEFIGRIVEQQAAAELINNPQHPYTQALLSAVPVLPNQTAV